MEYNNINFTKLGSNRNIYVTNSIIFIIVVFLYKSVFEIYINDYELLNSNFVKVIFIFLLFYILTMDLKHTIIMSILLLLGDYLYNINESYNENNNNNNYNYNYTTLNQSENNKIKYKYKYNEIQLTGNSLPNKETQLQDMELDTYYSEPGTNFTKQQVNMLGLKNDYNRTMTNTKNYMDHTNLLEPFCGSENCAI
jgi:hypothetical protein